MIFRDLILLLALSSRAVLCWLLSTLDSEEMTLSSSIFNFISLVLQRDLTSQPLSPARGTLSFGAHDNEDDNVIITDVANVCSSPDIALAAFIKISSLDPPNNSMG